MNLYFLTYFTLAFLVIQLNASYCQVSEKYYFGIKNDIGYNECCSLDLSLSLNSDGSYHCNMIYNNGCYADNYSSKGLYRIRGNSLFILSNVFTEIVEKHSFTDTFNESSFLKITLKDTGCPYEDGSMCNNYIFYTCNDDVEKMRVGWWKKETTKFENIKKVSYLFDRNDLLDYFVIGVDTFENQDLDYLSDFKSLKNTITLDISNIGVNINHIDIYTLYSQGLTSIRRSNSNIPFDMSAYEFIIDGNQLISTQKIMFPFIETQIIFEKE